jgi:hypothetical protein
MPRGLLNRVFAVSSHPKTSGVPKVFDVEQEGSFGAYLVAKERETRSSRPC